MDFPINPPIGERVRRKETQRFITGTGRYVDDLLPAGTLHVSFVRSSCAHAKIKSIDVAAARSMPGVRAVFTGTGHRAAREAVAGRRQLGAPAGEALSAGGG